MIGICACCRRRFIAIGDFDSCVAQIVTFVCLSRDIFSSLILHRTLLYVDEHGIDENLNTIVWYRSVCN